jgi:RNA polymerase sigma factor (sigma-70 family)
MNGGQKDLKAAIEANDKEAFNKAFTPFYLKEQRKLLDHANKKYRLSKDEISDLIQESLFISYQKCWAGKITDFSKLGGYTMGIFKNLIHTHLRKQKNLSTNSLEAGGLEIAEPAKPMEEPDLIEALEKCLRQLGGKCEQIIRLKMAQKSMQEIAETLGFSSSEVARTSKTRCMKQLRLCTSPDT